MKSYQLDAWLKELDRLHNRSLDYLILVWNTKDKYDRAIYKIKYQEWHDKFNDEVQRIFKHL